MSGPVPEGSSGPIGVPYGEPAFVSGWSLRSNSCLSVRSIALDFTRHALPPATIDDMDSMSNVVLAHNHACTAAQAMTYLVARSRRV
uniref:Uncharacterized protein n=1 Tax=Lactuca sativa TaxID=4236 RepID=A0A9R1X5U9_LACSA|nr:hypothetical protein LSAT_V11C600329620 [Lactuca sativa]